MEFPQVLSPQARWPGARGVINAAAPQAARDASAVPASEPGPWGVIWRVGAACWLLVTGTALPWMLPASGTTLHGVYVVSTPARAAQHLLVFLTAALGYRLAIALGWPAGVRGRVRVASVNTLLALAVAALSPIALAVAAALIDHHPLDMYQPLEGWAPLSAHWQSWAMPLRLFLPPYLLGLCAIALVLVVRRQHREALRAAELERACSAARIAMLSAQLQPHFLFNALHAISVLIDDSPRQAAAMLARLGDFLRHVLESTRRPWVDVATELAGLEAYLAVQQTRFSDHLSVAIDASPESLGLCVPPLLLQPLAENAIEHGRNGDSAVLKVRVAAAVNGGRLCIAVSNSSPRLHRELAPGEYGHALSNVRQRLRAAYAGDARLTIGPDAEGGTSAVLDLPVRRAAGRGPV
jgi:Histidine kinase